MKRKLIKLLLAMIVISGFYARIASAAPLTLSTDRIWGQDRVATAIAVSNKGWTTANNVILSELQAYPDALSATPLAQKLDAPILLTDGNTLDPRVSTELKRLQATHIVILGGEGLVTKQLTASLDELGLDWERIGGKDRYETSALIAQRIPSDTVIFVNGENFPDALVSAPYAGIKQIPLLLTQAQGIPAPIRQTYLQLHPTHVLVVGGTGVVPDSTLTNIPVETRIGGVDRYDTAAQIYRYAQATYSSPTAYIASGEGFADAMVGAALAAKTGSPLFLTQGTSVPATSYSVLSSAAKQTNPLQKIYILGGTGVVSSIVAETLEGRPPAGYLLAGRTIVVDPGHGSSDPGAIGPEGTKEKDVNLLLGLQVADILRTEGANVILTRTTDAMLGTGGALSDLAGRVAIANSSGADIFVSIHNNSYTSPSAQGTETLYNSNNPQATQSLSLATAVQKALVNGLEPFNSGLKFDRGVKDVNLYVTGVRINIPAILVEVQFISNPNGEQQLLNPTYRAAASQALVQGIENYFIQ
jgi:N-acetylmuramoyl-L-alanine amidase